MIPIARPCIGDEEIRRVDEVLRSGMLAQGELVEEFENKLASYIGTKYAVAVSSGTAALHVALISLGVGPGDYVAVPSYTFYATASSVILSGARPIFVDVDPRTATMDPNDLKKSLTPNTKAVIPVHIHGHPADLDSIRKVLSDREIYLLEDAAQAHGALYKGKKVGSLGEAGAFSFYPTKNMTTGEGGAITTDDEYLYQRAKAIRDQGQVAKYEHHYVGFNYRMTEINAAIGLVQLERLDEFNTRRREIADLYTEELSGLVGVPEKVDWAEPVWHLYPVKVGQNRDKAIKLLRERGISARPAYPMPLQKQPVMSRLQDREYNYLHTLFKDADYSSVETPNAEKLTRELLYLPLFHCMTDGEVERVIKEAKSVFSSI